MPGYHGTEGPMKISDLDKTPLVDVFLDAGKELGYDETDINGANQIGNSFYSFTRLLWLFFLVIIIYSVFFATYWLHS